MQTRDFYEKSVLVSQWSIFAILFTAISWFYFIFKLLEQTTVG